MLWTFRFLPFLLLFATTAPAQSELTIDKIGKDAVRPGGGVKTVAFTAMVEGVVADPNLSVYVLVKSPGAADERAFAAAVDGSRPDPAGGYRWRAVCQFGELMGASGGSYEAQAAAISSAGIQRGKLLETLKAGKLKSDVITVRRVNN